MLCAVKCAISGNWMSALKTKKGRPFLYCGRCRYGFRRTALTKSNLTKARKEYILTNPHYVVISTLEE